MDTKLPTGRSYLYHYNAKNEPLPCLKGELAQAVLNALNRGAITAENMLNSDCIVIVDSNSSKMN